MRFRSRRRRSRSTWGWADNFGLQCTSTAQTASNWLIPPGRVNWLCNNDRVASLKYMGSHLFLDFWYANTSSGGVALPDVTLYAIVAEQIEATPFAPVGASLQPWAQPETPATMTSWEEEDIDGTDSFLWTHHIKGFSPPNAIVSSGSLNDNQYNVMAAGSVDTPVYVCRKFHVTQEWQPDVIIRTKRRLKKDQGIALFMRSDTPIVTAGFFVNLTVHNRTLVSRGF